MKLHEFHARSLEATLILADESLLRMRRLVREAGQPGIVRQVNNSMSEEKRRAMLVAVEKLHSLFENLAREFSLDQRPLDLRRVIDAELSSLWVVLQDCRPDRMKGYGQDMAPEAQQNLLSAVENLLAHIEDMRALLEA